MRIYWLLFCLMSNIAFGQMIYDGEKAKFSASSSWDQNGSKLSQMTISAYSKPKHLRAVLKNKVALQKNGMAVIPKIQSCPKDKPANYFELHIVCVQTTDIAVIRILDHFVCWDFWVHL